MLDGVSTTLTGGDWNVPNTNYSAGNPDFAKLKINPDKFKISQLEKSFENAIAAYDSKTVSVGAADVTSVANGKIRTNSLVQIAGTTPSKSTVVS
ncbi:MAG: hypothetical protein WA194_01365 [Patescibacteria group bacterium]